MSAEYADTGNAHPKRALSEVIIGVVSTVARACVRSPELVEVEYDARRHRVTLSASPKDRGVLIGRDGKNLRALEDALALALAYQSDKRGVAAQELPLIELKGKREGSREGARGERQPSANRSDTVE